MEALANYNEKKEAMNVNWFIWIWHAIDDDRENCSSHLPIVFIELIVRSAANERNADNEISLMMRQLQFPEKWAKFLECRTHN